MQFKTKARAVDLLGKGQIADLPTSISELWKNGYDAYADSLGATLYTEGYEDVKDPFFVLSDNGKGMSKSELEDRWLVLGTDSKSRGKLLEKGIDTLWKEPRPLMGEKGIGRLSVAYLGSPMLMLTKKIGSPLQALYFDWRTLENYNLFLDDISIPIRPVPNLSSFKTVFNDLKADFLQNFIGETEEETEAKQAYWIDQEDILEKILSDSNEIDLVSFFEEEIVKDLIGDTDEIHGTKFVIFKPDEQFLMLKKWVNQQNNSDDQDIETVDDIRNGLIGFHNEFKYDIEDAPINTFFLIKDKTGERDFIGNNAFFSASDFEICDHLIDGSFDEFGTFTGHIRVYKETIEDYIFRPNRPTTEGTSYGKFNLKLGYVPGRQQTTLDEALFKYFEGKLDASGGLYVYRDDLRVLPYGRPYADFLGFEERRSRSAGFYFFSYRRMFGYIELSRESNRPLRDKAGREGFINNAAFRDFKIDLKAFFIDLAKEFFSTDAKREFKQKVIDELKIAKDNETKEKEKEREERDIFKASLKATPEKLASIKSKYRALIELLESKLLISQVAYQDMQQSLRDLDKLLAEFDSLAPSKPKRFNLNSREEEAFENLVDLYDSHRGIVDSAKSLRLEALKKIEEGQLLKEYENKFSQYVNLLDEITEQNRRSLETAFRKVDNEFERTKNIYKIKLQELYDTNVPHPATRSNLESSLDSLEEGFSVIQSKYKDVLESKSNYLLRMNFEIDDDALVGHYKKQYEETQQQLGDFKNLAQLGIAVEIINHELNSMYGQLNSSINTIPKYLNNSLESQKHYKYLKNAFEHLDSKYKTLNPLYRKARRTKQYVKGSDIKSYLSTFFEETFREERILLKSTKEFDSHETYTFESVLLPVFINVVNNAIYWLRSVENRSILLDYIPITNTMIICNSGPSIKDSRIEDIFELFYTRRPKGRGIGLFLSKDILNTVGLDIAASNDPEYNKLKGASFIIFNKE